MDTLFVLAHQDDEVISCGGLIQSLFERGSRVRLLTMFGRKYNYGDGYQFASEQGEDFKNACLTLGFKKILGLGTPAAVFFFGREEGEPHKLGYYDGLAKIEYHLKDFKPTQVVTHSPLDRNQDHRHLSELMDIALRPANLGSVRRVLHCHGFDGTTQAANLYVPMTQGQIDVQLAALNCYAMEVREAPHPRSEMMLKAQHKVNGSKCGVYYAEAYTLHLQID